ncbi:DUF4194 domain-containing protein [Demequina silvatica]|uniref:DUF4194 domain-containing protein n=1 Tax=Demequina silvatica TaxID=1638988 RepID=UPI000781A890|nr:DUF4194 domain-containing protein [Demequina silvatica]
MTATDHDLTAAGEAFAARPELWPGDTGTLTDGSRRALLSLVRGPYLSRDREPANWAALLADEPAIRSRLNDLFLDLVLDTDAEVAFVRGVAGEGNDAPVAVRSESLSYLDTVMLLALRQRLIHDEGHGRVMVGQDELYEELQVFRTPDRDESDFTKRLNSSWAKMLNKLRVLHAVEDGRAEISPVVRLLIDADRVRELRAAFDKAREEEQR